MSLEKQPVKFLCTCLFLIALAMLLPESAWQPLNRHTAAMTAHLLRMCGLPIVQQADLLGLHGFSVQIIAECTVLFPGILYASFVLAWPAGLPRKIEGLALGLPVLHTANIARLAIVCALGSAYPWSFEVMHVYLGQVAMVMIVLAACLVWLSVAGCGARAGAAASLPFLLRLGFYSTLAFLGCLALNQAYVEATDLVVHWLFSLWGYQVHLIHRHAYYYQTFNLAIFTGLMLACRNVPYVLRLWACLSGLALIIGLHILFRFLNVLMFMAPSVSQTAFDCAQAVHIAGGYLVPLMFWYRLRTAAFNPAIQTSSG